MSNRILDALPSAEQQLIEPHLMKIPLVAQQVVMPRAHQIAELMFLEMGLVSMTVSPDGNGETEVGLIGNEGCVGVGAMMNDAVLPLEQAMVQVAGSGWRLNADKARAVLPECPKFHGHCLRFATAMMGQTSQIAGCNLRHTVGERLARWLLMTRDRIQSDTLPLTQEFLSIMLGTRRAGVSVAAQTLQAAGIIEQGRGRVIVRDVAGLENAACPCYPLLRSLYETAF